MTRKQLSLLRSKPSDFDDNEESLIDFDIYVGYRRPDVVTDFKLDDNDLPEYIKWRLFLARQLALLKYRQTTSKDA